MRRELSLILSQSDLSDFTRSPENRVIPVLIVPRGRDSFCWPKRSRYHDYIGVCYTGVCYPGLVILGFVIRRFVIRTLVIPGYILQGFVILGGFLMPIFVILGTVISRLKHIFFACDWHNNVFLSLEKLDTDKSFFVNRERAPARRNTFAWSRTVFLKLCNSASTLPLENMSLQYREASWEWVNTRLNPIAYVRTQKDWRPDWFSNFQ